MPLLDRCGRLIEDAWTALADDAPLPVAPSGGCIVSLDRWRSDRDALTHLGVPLGVRLSSAQQADVLADAMPLLALIGVDLPKFRDGRAFSTARALRERFGFAGEIRAYGHIIPDQYVFLLRVGVDTVQIPQDKVSDAWARALGEIAIAYQPGLGAEHPLSGLRRRLRMETAQ
jgi:uncharacterized protein (DUF934 family)